MSASPRLDRRTALRTLGGLAVAGVAGCAGGGNGGGPTLSGSDYPSVDEWLTETEVGGADGTYEGTIADWREESEPTIDVGASGNGGNFAFGPSAVAVSPGTTVEWAWTGKGGEHSVDAEPDEQIGESDYEFASGEAEQGSDVTYTYTLDEAGVALYHCEPHLSLGMKGAVVVLE